MPLIELIDDPATLIEQLFIFPYTDETMARELFFELRERYGTNLLVASGFPPDANPHEVSHKLIIPTRQRGKSAAELVEMYLGGTLFGDMLGAELTQKQGVVFRYLARLMVSIPGATIHTLMQLMEDGRPFKPQMAQLEGSARYFFETEFFHPSFAAYPSGEGRLVGEGRIAMLSS